VQAIRDYGITPEAAAGPRDYKRGPCVHGNPCRESMCVEYGRSEAAAGPRDEGLREAAQRVMDSHRKGYWSADEFDALEAALAKASE